jgi:hypothetical protein
MQNFGVGHDTEWRSDCPGEACRVHEVPSNVAMLPVADTTTQKVGDAHEMFCTGLSAVPSSTRASWPQVVPSKRVATPAVLTEAQKVGDVHDTWYWPPVGPVGAGPTADVVVHVVPLNTTANWPLRATQKVGEAHDTEFRVPPPGVAGVGVDQRVPFHRTALPEPSTAAQKLEDGQETP